MKNNNLQLKNEKIENNKNFTKNNNEKIKNIYN